jgi:hypothetical protein
MPLLNIYMFKFVLLYYPPLAAGKMISYCLSFGSNTIPLTNLVSAPQFLNDSTTFKDKVAYIHDSIPNSKTEMSNWLYYEKKRSPLIKENLPNYIVNSDKIFFTIAHQPPDLQKISANYNTTIIQIVNSKKFRVEAALLGKHTYIKDVYDNIKGDDWPTFSVGLSPLYTDEIKDRISMALQEDQEIQTHKELIVDLDSIIFDEPKFVARITQLADYLGVQNFNVSEMSKFYRRYMELHS